ncbi:universal stress protein [Porticoccus sp.]
MKRFNSILCVVDPEESSDTAIIQAVRIANDHQADITFASVVRPARSLRGFHRSKEEYDRDFDALAEKKRPAIENRVAAIAPSMKANVEIYSGIGFIQIIKSVLNKQHDLVIKCAEDTDWVDRLFGSEDMHLLRKCPCPVLMLKPDQRDSFRNILATVDVGDDSSELDDGRVQERLNKEVLAYSVALCIPELTEIYVGSAWEAYAEDFYRYGVFSQLPEDKVDLYVAQVRRECSDNLEILVREMGDMLGKDAVQYLQPRTYLVKGKPSKEIPLMAEKYGIDLIVMGTVGRIGVPGLIIGNTAESILEQVKCSVLAIKPEGFETPVV